MKCLSVAVALSALGCGVSSQEEVELPAFFVGDPSSATTQSGWEITLSRAEVAFGPAYFCAAASGSSTLCESAAAELASITRVDALSGDPAPIGIVHAATGDVQSVAYDFGIHWFDTETHASASPQAPGGHSMRLEGVATRAGETIAFSADVDVVPQYRGQHAIPTQPAFGRIGSDPPTLQVRVSPARWFGQLDFDVLAGAPSVAIEPGTAEHNAILVGIKVLAPADLVFVEEKP